VPTEDVFGPVWSPDGKRLLYRVRNVGSRILQLTEPSSAGEPLPGRELPGFIPWSWSPDGRSIAGWWLEPKAPENRVVIFSFGDQRYIELTNSGINPIWLNDSRRLIFISLNSMYLVDKETRQTRLLRSGEAGNFGIISLSSDNRRLFYSLISSEADIHLLALD